MTLHEALFPGGLPLDSHDVCWRAKKRPEELTQPKRAPKINEPRKEKTWPYFPLNPGCLTGILIMAYYNPYIAG